MLYSDLRRFINIEPLYTERLVLRRLTRYDLEDVYAYCSDPQVSKYLLWSPHESMRTTRQYLTLVERKYRSAEFYDWGVEYEGRIIGTCGFTSFSVVDDSAQIGYVLSSEFWGRGIATEMLKSVIRYGFDVLSLNRIEGRYMKENVASLAVMNKCHMTLEGIHKEAIYVKNKYCDVGVCAITRSEFERLSDQGIF